MKDPRFIHETALAELIAIWDSIKSTCKDISDNGGKNFLKNKTGKSKQFTSIARAASNLTLVFPVLCSRAISIETASMVNKAIEKNCVSMMQKLFASWQIADNNIENVQDYINQFHSNINSRSATLDDFFDATTRIEKFKECVEDIQIKNIFEAAAREDMRNLDYYLPSSISERSLNRYIVTEAGVAGTTMDQLNAKLDELDKTRKEIERERERLAKDKEDLKKLSSDDKKNNVEYFSKQVPNTEYKKANELMPSSLIVNFKVKRNDGGDAITVDNAVVGIKAKLYPLASDDIVSHVGDKVESKKNWLVNFFRATTRETSFWKDFILGVDKAKIDAMSMSQRNSSTDKMWKVLERRATNAKFKRLTSNDNGAAAISTLVLSQEEVDWLRKHKNIDMERLANVIGLFESLNLMSLVIVDESLEVAKFIYDENDPMWETISFTHLEREASDGAYKKMVNLITKTK